MNYQVKFARLHNNMYFSGTGEIGNVLPPRSKTLDNLEMSTDGTTVLVQYKYKGVFKAHIVPCTNFVVLDIVPPSAKASAAKVAKKA